MNLPNFHKLNEDVSTYITFSKAFKDLDIAIEKGEKFYFTKVVALNLPKWQNNTANKFFTDRLKELNIPEKNITDPNVVLPKILQYYTENIIRQTTQIQNTQQLTQTDEIVELAFWKTLNLLGMTYEQIKQSIVFSNDIVTSNYLTTEVNNGWTEIIVQIPNLCKKFNLKTREVTNINELVSTNDSDQGLYDNGNKQFLFDTKDKRSVIDFNKSTYDSVVRGTFDFNVLLLFYTDKSGVDKLHGINFIYPFENKVTYYDMVTFTQKTNVTQTIGYQFLFNLKTAYNNNTLASVYHHNEHAQWWNGYEKTLTQLGSFLEQKMIEQKTDINTIPDVKYVE